MITSIKQAEAFFRRLIPNAKEYAADGLSLSRMWPLLELVGNPQENVRAVHIAGTSGKTSTSYYVEALLRASGKKTVLTVSPHLTNITERLQLNGEPISDDLFCDYLNQFLQQINVDKAKPSYFELLMVFVLWVSVKEAADYVVLETGLGGLLDSTNVVTRADKVCILTDIGYDHMDFLGNTLADIAAQKAGIMHEGNVAFSYEQGQEIMHSFEEKASSIGAELRVVDEPTRENEATLAGFQSRNFGLAKAACQYIAQRDSFTLTEIDPAKVVIPGRMEILEGESGVVVLDGAHNEQKMQAFVSSFMTRFPGQKTHVMLAMKQGKELEKVLSLLKPITLSLIATKFDGLQDAPFTAVDSSVIASLATKLGINNVSHLDDPMAATDLLLKRDGIKTITGSLYLLANVRSTLAG